MALAMLYKARCQRNGAPEAGSFKVFIISSIVPPTKRGSLMRASPFSHTSGGYATFGPPTYGPLARIWRVRKVQNMKHLMTIAGRALLGVLLIVIVLNLPRLLDNAAGELTGWDDGTKQMYADQVALNNQYVEIATMRQALRRASAD
jgi:hypothetical protein